VPAGGARSFVYNPAVQRLVDRNDNADTSAVIGCGVAGAATQTVRAGEVHSGHSLSTAHDPGRCGYEPDGDTCTLVSVFGLRNRSNTIGSSSSGTTEVMSIFGSAWPLSSTSATY
jgi:hypothetical protein